MNKDVVSIIIPVYNHAATIEETIESVLSQKTNYSYRILCFNDASTDKSKEILNKYATKFPEKIKIYHNEFNIGSAITNILTHCPKLESSYWCILEGDDYWISPNKLTKQIEFLDQNKDYVGCSSNTTIINELNESKSIIQPSVNNWNYLDMLMLNKKYAFYVHTSSILWRNIYSDKPIFLPPLFRNKNIRGDTILLHQMLVSGKKMHNIPEEMSCYRITGKGIWTQLSEEEKQIRNTEVMKKNQQNISMKFKYLIFINKILNWLKKTIPGPLNS